MISFVGNIHPYQAYISIKTDYLPNHNLRGSTQGLEGWLTIPMRAIPTIPRFEKSSIKNGVHNLEGWSQKEIDRLC